MKKFIFFGALIASVAFVYASTWTDSRDQLKVLSASVIAEGDRLDTVAADLEAQIASLRQQLDAANVARVKAETDLATIKAKLVELSK